MGRFKEFWTPQRLLDAALVVSVIFVTVMSLHPNLLVSRTLITGGDTGSHLAAPAYLRTTGNIFNFTPWYPGWFDGLPLYTYYFVLPDVLISFFSYVVGFAVAMKLGTVLGSVLLPLGAYAMGRLFRAPRPVPVALAMATLPFLFDASFTIDGGNLFSTMAGEYAFSLSLALALLTVGLFARGLRTGKGYWLAALSLTLTLASHVLPWLFSLGAIAVLVVFELLLRRGVGEALPTRRTREDNRANRLGVGLGLLLLGFLPFFFDSSFAVNATGTFSVREPVLSLLITLGLALLTIARFRHGVPPPRDRWLVVVDVAATAASLVVITRYGFVLLFACTALELFQRRGPGESSARDHALGDYARPIRFAVGAGVISVGLSAWWLLPFATTQSLTDSLGYVNENVNSWRGIFTLLGWFNATGGAAGDRWVIVAAGVATLAAFVVRDRLGMVLASLTVGSFWAFALDPQSAIWDQRLMPFWYVTIHLSVGWLVGYFAWRWARRVPARLSWAAFFEEGRDHTAPDQDKPVLVAPESTAIPEPAEPPNDPQRLSRRLFRATCAVGLLGLLSTVPGQITPVANDLHLATGGNQVSAWAQYNYSGYQTKPGWAEYHDIITTMTRVAAKYGCGRAMWEYSFNQENPMGTPEALMLLPYWTNNCVDTMEGLLMESSPTTPYHYLDQSELSVAPSNPQVGLDYGPLDVALGVRHLQMLGVKYFMAFSPQVIAQAGHDRDLKLVATTRTFPAPGAQWRIYLIKNSPMVQALRHDPNVVANVASQAQWLNANQTWWLTPSLQRVYLAMSGPASWPRAAHVTSMTAPATLPPVTITHVTLGLQSLSFHVSRIGVPVLVKMSYYPRWHVTGATGPYRVSPNLMVVVPTARTVTLNYTSTPALSIGNLVSDLTVLAGCVSVFLVLRRRRMARR
ncbi:MAG: hypothetical protein JWM55_92 [Acidimicrobiaceae bacterium]|nr:hypothetical protein [Acidimicrobiaceae bacterium]